MGLMADLVRGPVGVDTAVFIYFIAEHTQFLPLVEPLFREVNEGRSKELVTSTLTLLEVLVVPYRSGEDRKSTRLNSSHLVISYAVFCLKKNIIPLHM